MKIESRLRIIFWFVAIILGALQAWGSRHMMDSDGVSYLDHGDAFFRGDWGLALNAFWSPLYSWLLGLALFLLRPSPYWEYSVVHLVNFLIYLGALGSFEFLLQELIRYQELRQERIACEKFVAFPSWTWQVLGYSLFIWSSLVLITLREVTPDMAVAAFVYLAIGILLRIKRGRTTWPNFILLGAVLGTGYLVKSPMFPLSLVFLLVCLFSAGKLKKALPRTFVALAVFISIALPYVIVTSRTSGHLTLSESARIHYFWYINNPDMSRYPNIEKIFDFPAVYEFGAPIQGTYPVWFDPAYWSRDVAPHYFDLKGLAQIFFLSAKRYYGIFLYQQGPLIVCFFLLLYMSPERWLWIKSIRESWILILPGAAALAMYFFTPVFTRYIGPFVVLFWSGLFSGIRLSDSRESRRLLAGVTWVLMTMMAIQVAREEIPLVRSTVRQILRGEEPTAHPAWLVASHLNRMGIQAGDKVTAIGNYFHAFWARLARVRIVAEIHHTDSSSFWTAGPEVQSKVIQAFRTTGAKVIVAERVPPTALTEDWQRVEDTDFFIRLLGESPR